MRDRVVLLLIKQEKIHVLFFSLERKQGLAKQIDVPTFIYRLYQFVYWHDKRIKHSIVEGGGQSNSSSGISFLKEKKSILASQMLLDDFNHCTHIS